MFNFAGLWCPSRLTHTNSWGIMGYWCSDLWTNSKFTHNLSKIRKLRIQCLAEAELLMLIVVMCQWPSLFMLFHAFFQPSLYFVSFHPPPPLVYAQCLVRTHAHHLVASMQLPNDAKRMVLYRFLVVTPCFNACFSMPQNVLGVGVGLKVDNSLSNVTLSQIKFEKHQSKNWNTEISM